MLKRPPGHTDCILADSNMTEEVLNWPEEVFNQSVSINTEDLNEPGINCAEEKSEQTLVR